MPNRRHFIKSAAGLVLMSSAPSLWASRAAAASVDELVAAAKAAGQMKVVVSIGSGVYLDTLKELFFNPFTAETGIETAFVGGSYSEVLTKVHAMSEADAMEWDIVTTTVDSVRSPTFANYVEDLGHCSQLSNVVSEGIEGSCLGNAVLWAATGNGIAYDESAFPNGGMKSWADFWDVEAFPGPRALPNYGTPWYVLSAALLADGVEPKDVYPLDLDRAFKKLDELKPNIAVWWTSGDQALQLLRTKEVVATMVWNGRVASLRKEGFPISFVWNGAMLDADAIGITKGAPHKIAAMALLNYLYTRPKAAAELAKRLNYSIPNKHTGDFVDADVASNLPTAPENWSKLMKSDSAWLAENSQKLIERWTTWISG
ncbi:ABC transporter substrate-binding protein [Mesorhizobium sangaii]|uniref:Mannopine transport system substrate-binding protein n=1 Tax=Mesorhizobium sangaii TaxID=505389 RepID=A0A841PGS3_9HYPH|nr:ABC transporter substrate-binding protein [Mesorhizobium sangaii]MBB6414346.1 mannopine transport system substrate-binding protein [Mesorhizobium sangaii]